MLILLFIRCICYVCAVILFVLLYVRSQTGDGISGSRVMCARSWLSSGIARRVVWFTGVSLPISQPKICTLSQLPHVP